MIKIIKKIIAGLIAWHIVQFIMTGDQAWVLLTGYYLFLVEVGVALYFILNTIFNIRFKRKEKDKNETNKK